MHSKKKSFMDTLEETLIATILGLMTLITFVNVVLRYTAGTGFGAYIKETLGINGGLIWGLEMTSVLFAWLVLLGMSYCIKITAHLGVDSVINIFKMPTRRKLALLATAISIIYALLLLKASYDYFANFANLPATTGHWFPTGFEELTQNKMRGWYELERIPMVDWLRFIEPTMLLEGDPPYNKVPRFLAYIILPVGAALLLFRLAQAFTGIAKGTRATLIVSHEAEDEVKEVAAKAAQEA